MKDLSSEQIKSMTLKEAWDIGTEFGDYLANRKPVFMEYESVLPYHRDVINLALLKIFTDEDFSNMSLASEHAVTPKEIKENIATSIYYLNSSFIPDEKQYKEMVELMEMGNKRIQ